MDFFAEKKLAEAVTELVSELTACLKMLREELSKYKSMEGSMK